MRLEKANEGSYMCLAYNAAGTATGNAQVRVQCKTDLEFPLLRKE